MFKQYEKYNTIRNVIKLFKYPKHRYRKYNTRSVTCAYRAHDVAWDGSANGSCGASTIQSAECDLTLNSGYKSFWVLPILIVQVSHHRARRESKQIPPVWQLLLLRHPSINSLFKYWNTWIFYLDFFKFWIFGDCCCCGILLINSLFQSLCKVCWTTHPNIEATIDGDGVKCSDTDFVDGSYIK